MWELRQGDEFGLAPRSDQQRTIEGEPSSELPTFDRGGASCDITMSALVAGPWLDGHAQTTRDLVRSTLWLPVYLESESVSLLTNPNDIDIALVGDLESLEATGAAAATVRYAEHDRKLGLRPGATKERLPHVVAQRRHKIEIGDTLARVRLEYGPTHLGGGSDFDGGFSP